MYYNIFLIDTIDFFLVKSTFYILIYDIIKIEYVTIKIRIYYIFIYI